jgi:asparagine synthase (glutamine-hydrolysing)
MGERFAGSDTEAVERLDEVLRAAVRAQMVADVPLGAFLSGGVDSSTIVALMQAQSSQPVKTFTIGFFERGFNEAEHAAEVAKHLGTEHTELYVTSKEAMDVIPRLSSMYDEPFADGSQIPTFLVSQLARRHVTVSLSGDGGDELFGGYNRYFLGPKIWKRIRAIPRGGRKAIGHGLEALGPESWDRMADRVGGVLPATLRHRHLGEKIGKLARAMTAGSPDGIFQSLVTNGADLGPSALGARDVGVLLTEPSRWPPIDDFAERMMYLDALTYLPDDILVKVDRAAMAVNLETRVPFLDHRVVEFAWTLPLSMKVRDGKGKWLLREVLDRYVPRALIERPKMGFGVPLGAWLRGPLRGWAEDLLDEGRLRGEGFLDPTAVRRLWDQHVSGRADRYLALWSVLMFEAWLEETR